MNATALRFIAADWHPNILNNLLATFRAKGFVVVPDVFERDSVDAYFEQVIAALDTDPTGKRKMPMDQPAAVAPLLAPRLRAVLPGALSPYRMAPEVSVHEVAWLIADGGQAPHDDGWHKDRGHEGMPGGSYLYPGDVHIGMYFRDMTVADGPTQAVPGSHIDPRLSPYDGSPIESFLPRKQDVVLWDQRVWHRGAPRTAEGERVFALYGFYALPRFRQNRPVQMPQALAALHDASEEVGDQLFYAGVWSRQETPDRSRFWNWDGK